MGGIVISHEAATKALRGRKVEQVEVAPSGGLVLHFEDGGPSVEVAGRGMQNAYEPVVITVRQVPPKKKGG